MSTKNLHSTAGPQSTKGNVKKLQRRQAAQLSTPIISFTNRVESIRREEPIKSRTKERIIRAMCSTSSSKQLMVLDELTTPREEALGHVDDELFGTHPGPKSKSSSVAISLPTIFGGSDNSSRKRNKMRREGMNEESISQLGPLDVSSILYDDGDDSDQEDEVVEGSSVMLKVKTFRHTPGTSQRSKTPSMQNDIPSLGYTPLESESTMSLSDGLRPDRRQKYFGVESQLNFYNTYHELDKRKSIFVGGCDELNSTLLKPDIENSLVYPISMLMKSGVITPLPSARSNSNSSSMFLNVEKAHNGNYGHGGYKQDNQDKERIGYDEREGEVNSFRHVMDVSHTLEDPSLQAQSDYIYGLDKNDSITDLTVVNDTLLDQSATLRDTEDSEELKTTNMLNETLGEVDLIGDEANLQLKSLNEHLSTNEYVPEVANNDVSHHQECNSVDELTLEPSVGLPSLEMSYFGDHVDHVGNLDFNTLQTSSVGNVNSSLGSEVGNMIGSSQSGSMGFEYEDVSIVSSYGPQSPRAMFLVGCLKLRLPPRTVSLLRKRMTATLNLTHLGLGDKVVQLLAQSLGDMPLVSSLLLSDNNLSDAGVMAVVNALPRMQNILRLDLGKSVMSDASLISLSKYLSDPNCTLVVLNLEDCNLDDTKFRVVLDALTHQNKTIQKLDLSRNSLGVASGQALAHLLSNSKTLVSLGLHWNNILAAGAGSLFSALPLSHTLVFLDVSNNSIGRDGGLTVGATLLSSSLSLSHIDLSNNNMDPVACFCILIAARENERIKSIILDGNVLGAIGGRLLMRMLPTCGHRLSISVKGCAVRGGPSYSSNLSSSASDSDTSTALHQYSSHPLPSSSNFFATTYKLNLSDPYGKACALDLFDFVSRDPNLTISSLQFHSNSKTNIEEMTTEKCRIDRSPSCKDEEDEVSALTHLLSLNPNHSVAHIKTIFAKVKIRGDRSTKDLNETEFHQFLKAIVVGDHELDRRKGILNLFDGRSEDSRIIDNDGGSVKIKQNLTLEKSQLQMKCFSLHKLEEVRTKASNNSHVNTLELSDCIRCALYIYKTARNRLESLTSSPSLKICGKLWRSNIFELLHKNDYMQVVVSQRSSDCSGENPEIGKDEFDCLSWTQVTNALTLAHSSIDPCTLLKYFLENSRVHLEEAQILVRDISTFSEGSGIVEALSAVLPALCSPIEATSLIYLTTVPKGLNIIRVREQVKAKIGSSLFNVINGDYNGYYVFDVSKDLDRECLKRLMIRLEFIRKLLKSGVNVEQLKYVSLSHFWDEEVAVERKAFNFTCFRDEIFNGESFTISLKWLRSLPDKGRLRFDFSDWVRPSLTISHPMSDMKFIEALKELKLVNESSVEAEIADRLDHLHYSQISDWKIPAHRIEKGLKIAKEMINHQMLSRLSEFQKSLKREEGIGTNEIETSAQEEDEAVALETAETSIKEIGIEEEKVPNHVEADDNENGELNGKETTNDTISQGIVLDKGEVISTVEGLEGRKTAMAPNEKTSVQTSNKCYDMIQRIQHILCNRFIYARQLSVLLDLFHWGRTKKTPWGNYRVEVLVQRIPYVVDLENMGCIYTKLSGQEIAGFCNRVGLHLPGLEVDHSVDKLVEFTIDDFFEKMRRVAAGIDEDENKASGKKVEKKGSKLSSNAKIDVRLAFKKFDKDGSGEINKQELLEIFDHFGLFVDEQTADAVWNHFDLNGSGSVNCGEFIWAYFNRGKFVKSYEKGSESLSLAEAQERFKICDENGDGLIQEQELFNYLLSLGVDITDEDNKALFKTLDKGGDGTINFKEFTKFIEDERKKGGLLSKTVM